MKSKPSRQSTPDPVALLNTIGPTLRGLLSDGPTLKIVTFDDSTPVRSFVRNSRLMSLLDGVAPSRGNPVGAIDFPLTVALPAGGGTAETVDALRGAIHRHAGAFGRKPNAVLVAGLGLFTAGNDWQGADAARQRCLAAIRHVAGGARNRKASGSGIHGLFAKGQTAGSCCCPTGCGVSQAGRVANKVAVITGGAQGFGLEIARQLAAGGAHVALLDINQDGAAAAAQSVVAEAGPGRAVGLAANVTSADSIAAALHAVVRLYGGFDVFISNAGVLKAGSVKSQPAADFDFVTAVNYKGYFLCVQQAAPILAAQHHANAGYWSDIIQVNSKSGLEGSNRNGAYAGSKFGGIGLTQSFALELVEDNIKVNAICPGNFFDGPLWSDPNNGLFVQYLRTGKVPGARTIADVRKFYEAKVPMRRGCEAADVVKAIYYLMEQTYETGQAVPVTGGQVMLS